MTSLVQVPPNISTAPPVWTWPVNLATYDRSELLSEDERVALAQLTATRKVSGRWETKFGPALSRLLRPLDDVLAITGGSKVQRNGSIILLLREMHRLQRSFLAWSAQEWIGLLHPNAAEFAEHNNGVTSYRPHLLAISYILGNLNTFAAIGHFSQAWLATRVFGQDIVEPLAERVGSEMVSMGFGAKMVEIHLHNLLYEVLLMNRSPRLEDLTFAKLTEIRPHLTSAHLKSYVVSFTQALVSLGYLDRAITVSHQRGNLDALSGVPQEWLNYCERWRKTSTLSKSSHKVYYWSLVKVGRWLAQYHPEITSPAQWTREVAADYVAAVMTWSIGDWTHRPESLSQPGEVPLSAKTKVQQLKAMSTFIRDCQEWNWIPRRLDARRSFTTPRSLQSLLGPNPRAIDDEVWAKLMWAGLNLAEADMPKSGNPRVSQRHNYPFELVRACTLVWIFTGLRADEICRLNVGCIRWQTEDMLVTGTDQVLAKNSVCWLSVPVNKTAPAFTKPVDRMVGEAIDAWERIRPRCGKEIDRKSGELVEYLFSFKGRRISMDYLNHTVIPMLCAKAGLAQADSLGAITSHRARSTIATQLFNAKEPMSLFELQEWLGHRYASSTQHYAKVKLTKLAKSFTQAGYFERNIRVIEVLLDQDAVLNGAAAAGEPWRFYDLGHGYCWYDFFDQCPHRMACAKCAFYIPKESTKAQLLEGKAHLQRLLQEIPLTEDERAAVEDGIGALEKLATQLADVPTPGGPTPRQIQEMSGHRSFIALQAIQRRR